MTFDVKVIYQIHDGNVMHKELNGVDKVERTFEKINNENVEIVRVYTSYYNWCSWSAKSILLINMTPNLN